MYLPKAVAARCPDGGGAVPVAATGYELIWIGQIVVKRARRRRQGKSCLQTLPELSCDLDAQEAEGPLSAA